MRRVISLDRQFTEGGTFHDILPASNGLSSSWPDLPCPEPQPPERFWLRHKRNPSFRMEYRSKEQAEAARAVLGPSYVLVTWTPTEEEYAAELEQARRENRWRIGIGY